MDIVHRPILIMLIGLPGTGKSTWVNEFLGEHKGANFGIVSTDNVIQTFASQNGFTYNQFFNDITYACAEKISHHTAKLLFEHRRNVIWDQTNLTKKSRAKKLNMVPMDYKRTALYIMQPPGHQERLDKRAIEEGKHIPDKVMASMSKSLQPPDFTEEFDTITTYCDGAHVATMLREVARYVP